MSKYIIINCPACVMGWNTNYECLNNGLDCGEVTNCLLKRIVKKCKKAENACFTSGNMDMFLSGRSNLAGNILAMLDIQECE